jgi:hypothetical protein
MICRVVELTGTASPQPVAGDGRVDPDHPRVAGGQGAAGVARVERGVGLDHVVDQPDQPPVPRRDGPAEAADHARRHRTGQPQRVADRDDELPDPEYVGVAERGGRRTTRVCPQYRQVGQRIGAHHVEP